MCNRYMWFIKGQNMDQQHCSDLFPSPLRYVSSLLSPSLLSFSLCLIYPASRPWGGTALGRLLTQEKRAFNVMSLCRKAWQSQGLDHLLEEINTSPSSFSECNGLDITSPVGHYGPWIINPSNGVYAWVFVCAYMCLNEHMMCMCMCLHMHVLCSCVFYVSVGGLRAQFEAICPLERKRSTISTPRQLEAARQP